MITPPPEKLETLITSVVGHHMTMITTNKNIGTMHALMKHYGIKNVGIRNMTVSRMQTIGIINAVAKQRGYLKMVDLVKKINAINGVQEDADEVSHQDADKDTQQHAQTGVQQNVLTNKSRCCF